jgi:hypothetical protein
MRTKPNSRNVKYAYKSLSRRSTRTVVVVCVQITLQDLQNEVQASDCAIDAYLRKFHVVNIHGSHENITRTIVR